MVVHEKIEAGKIEQSNERLTRSWPKRNYLTKKIDIY
jgi:hypothetical protein